MNQNEFQRDYRDLVNDIMAATYQSFDQRLADWFSLLDENQPSRSRVLQLQGMVNFDEWYGDFRHRTGILSGEPLLQWDTDRTKRLGQYLTLFRYLLGKEENAIEFGRKMVRGRGPNEIISNLTQDIFKPFTRDLLKDIERQYAQKEERSTQNDEIVPIDQSADAYHGIMTQLHDLEAALIQSNELGGLHDADGERRMAEIKAGKALLGAKSVRLNVLMAVLVPALSWLAVNFASGLIGVLANALLAALAGFFGIHIAGIN